MRTSKIKIYCNKYCNWSCLHTALCRLLALSALSLCSLCCSLFDSIRPWWYVKIYDDFNLMLNRMKIQPKIKLKQTSIFRGIEMQMYPAFAQQLRDENCFVSWMNSLREMHSIESGDLKYGIKAFLFFFLLLFSLALPCALHSYILICILFFGTMFTIFFSGCHIVRTVCHLMRSVARAQ